MNRKGCKSGYELGLTLFINFCKKFGEKWSRNDPKRMPFTIAVPKVRPGSVGRQVGPANVGTRCWARADLSHVGFG